MTFKKIQLNLSEQNELGFKLKIEGNMSEIRDVKPKIRFSLTEDISGQGWIFGTTKSENDDGVVVTIPSMKGLINEANKYVGKLEVVIGEHFFTPTEIEIDFVEPIKVESTIVSTKAKRTLLEEQLASIILPKEEDKTKKTEEAIEEERQALAYSKLNESQKKEINKIFVEKCKKLDPVNFKTAKDVSFYMKEGTDYTKKRLRALISQSTIEYLNAD